MNVTMEILMIAMGNNFELIYELWHNIDAPSIAEYNKDLVAHSNLHQYAVTFFLPLLFMSNQFKQSVYK